MQFTRRQFVQLLTTVAGCLGLTQGRSLAKQSASENPSGAGAMSPDHTIWLEQPAKAWIDAFPVGNGRIGAMIFGGVESERLALNEDTLWSGMPRDCNNPGAKAHLPVVRKLVLEDKDYQRADLECHKMMGPWNEAYQPLGDLIIEMDYGVSILGKLHSYKRTLDLDSAVATIAYAVGDVRYRREVFVSMPDNVLAIRLTASKAGALNGTIRFKSQLQAKTIAGGRTLTLSGKAPKQSLPNYIQTEPAIVYSDVDGEGMHFASVAQLEVPDGRLEPQWDGSMKIVGSSEVVVLVGCATGFRNFAVAPDIPLAQVVQKSSMAASQAGAKSYEQLLRAHIKDYQGLYRRVNLELESSENASLPTDKRVEAFAKNPDPSLTVLFFNFGRYLLIASSRPGTQPANLQGIWSADLRPPWSCNWTTNINVQMNYWMAETCNLSECHLPLITMVRDLSMNGAKTATVNYGNPGWCAHHNVDLWMQSAPAGDGLSWAKPTWANWCMSGQWLCAHLWDHYTFTQDKQYLRDIAYPVIHGSAEFCAGWLIEDGQGGLTTCPSVSPENSFIAPNGKPADVSAGTTMDIALTREIFDHCIEASRILSVDDEFRARLSRLIDRLPPYKVGSLGQVQEWSIDFVEANPGSGHLSALYEVYPGTQITPRRNPLLAKAAAKTLEHRLQYHGGGKAPFAGWPGAWCAMLWARLGNGNNAWELVRTLIDHAMTGNLMNDCFDTHPAELGGARRPTPGVLFQIDANLGAPAAMAEMLLQSHDGEIAFLPALPDAWTKGRVKGLRARGDLEASIEWTAAKTSTATVHTFAESRLRFRAPNGHTLKQVVRTANGNEEKLSVTSSNDGLFSLDCGRGETYRFSFAKG